MTFPPRFYTPHWLCKGERKISRFLSLKDPFRAGNIPQLGKCTARIPLELFRVGYRFAIDIAKRDVRGLIFARIPSKHQVNGKSYRGSNRIREK
jgi:hypothetical protein